MKETGGPGRIEFSDRDQCCLFAFWRQEV